MAELMAGPAARSAESIVCVRNLSLHDHMFLLLVSRHASSSVPKEQRTLEAFPTVMADHLATYHWPKYARQCGFFEDDKARLVNLVRQRLTKLAGKKGPFFEHYFLYFVPQPERKAKSAKSQSKMKATCVYFTRIEDVERLYFKVGVLCALSGILCNLRACNQSSCYVTAHVP